MHGKVTNIIVWYPYYIMLLGSERDDDDDDDDVQMDL